MQGEADIVTGTAPLPTQASGHRVLRAEASPKGARSRPEVSGQVEEASVHVKRGSEPRGHRHPPLPPVLSPPRHLSNTPPCAGKPPTPPPWGARGATAPQAEPACSGLLPLGHFCPRGLGLGRPQAGCAPSRCRPAPHTSSKAQPEQKGARTCCGSFQVPQP